LVQRAHEIIRARTLYFAESPRYSPLNLRSVAALAEGGSGQRAQRRILIVRRDAGRQFVNSDEVEAVCARFGFEPVDTSALTVAEQIDLFRDARHVVGAHGAGLANVMFRGMAQCNVLELFPGSPHSIGWPMCHYFYLCRALGHAYGALVATPVGADSSNRGGHMRVDRDALTRSLERMTSEPD
jgi:capsular polysaccharide biosynthesis protein